MPDPVQRLIGGLALLLTLPLQAALAVAVRLDSRGPALFTPSRVGEGGRPFRLYKLRTMRVDAGRGGPAISLADDHRVTRVGRLLRRTRLDELPQLWNVARGDMRLVGPRPEDPRYVDPSDPIHAVVFTARPGITGLAQLVHTRESSRIDPADPDGSYRSVVLPAKVALDAAYLRRRSVGLDLWILARTALVIAGRPPSGPEVAARVGAGPWDPPAAA